jgi:serine/threonine-protein kinase OSR1/STK39
MSTLANPTVPFIGAVKDDWQLFRYVSLVLLTLLLHPFISQNSDRAEDYTLGPPIGFGSSSIVYHATYLPKDSLGTPTPCALKVLDLDRLPEGSLRLLRRETQLMSLSKHPNVLRVRGSWLDGHKLLIALRLMNAGSAADVMHYAWPGGMEEEVIRCILKQALEGLKQAYSSLSPIPQPISNSTATCISTDLFTVISKQQISSSTMMVPYSLATSALPHH